MVHQKKIKTCNFHLINLFPTLFERKEFLYLFFVHTILEVKENFFL